MKSGTLTHNETPPVLKFIYGDVNTESWLLIGLLSGGTAQSACLGAGAGIRAPVLGGGASLHLAHHERVSADTAECTTAQSPHPGSGHIHFVAPVQEVHREADRASWIVEDLRSQTWRCAFLNVCLLRCILVSQAL